MPIKDRTSFGPLVSKIAKKVLNNLLFAARSVDWPSEWSSSCEAPLPWLLSIEAGEIEPTLRSIEVNPGGPPILLLPIIFAALEFSSKLFKLLRVPSVITEPDTEVGGEEEGDPGEPIKMKIHMKICFLSKFIFKVVPLICNFDKALNITCRCPWEEILTRGK